MEKTYEIKKLDANCWGIFINGKLQAWKSTKALASKFVKDDELESLITECE